MHDYQTDFSAAVLNNCWLKERQT